MWVDEVDKRNASRNAPTSSTDMANVPSLRLRLRRPDRKVPKSLPKRDSASRVP
jgi:hypothetical protein